MRLAIRVCNSICRSNASAARPAVHPRSCKYELFAGAVLPRWYCPMTSPTNRSGLTPSGPNSLINRVSIRECFVRTVLYNFYVLPPRSSATTTWNFTRTPLDLSASLINSKYMYKISSAAPLLHLRTFNPCRCHCCRYICNLQIGINSLIYIWEQTG